MACPALFARAQTDARTIDHDPPHHYAMTVRLRVISGHRRQLSGRDSIEFGPEGGSIGRSADNDWVLPDPHRYVSARHARISCREGRYYLEDLSTNGVYVNDKPEPLAQRGSEGYRLRDGDVLRLGEYQIGVSLEAHTSDSAALPSRIMAVQPLGSAQTDIGAQLNLEDLLTADPASTGELQPGNALGQGRGRRADGPPSPRVAERPRTPADNGEDTLARRLGRVSRAAAREEGANTASDDSGWRAFCRGAGVKPEQMPAQAEMMHLAGRLLRESLVGLKDLERSRSQARERFHIQRPPPEPDAPPLGQLTVEELLLALFCQHDAHAVDAVRWLRERHDEVKAHELALVQAFRAAFIEFLGRLDPAELEARFAQGRRGKPDPAQYWGLFTSFYRNLLDRPADHLPPTFVEAFASAYKESLHPQTLDMPRSVRPKRAHEG